jgi:hypothetical protein
VLFGRVIGLRDVITFQGESVIEVTKAFHDSVSGHAEVAPDRAEIRFGAGPRARKDIDAAKRSAGRCGRLRGRGWRHRTWEEGETLV